MNSSLQVCHCHTAWQFMSMNIVVILGIIDDLLTNILEICHVEICNLKTTDSFCDSF